MEKRGSIKNRIIGFVLAIGIIGFLIIAGPAKAVTVSLTHSSTSGEAYTYQGLVDIHTNDFLKVDYVAIRITNENTSVTSTCYYNLSTRSYDSSYSTNTENICSSVSVSDIGDYATAATSSGHGYGYGYGSGNSSLGFSNVSWANGAGYGYQSGYGYDSYSTSTKSTSEFRFNFTFNSTSANITDNYQYTFKAGVAGVESSAILYTYYNQNNPSTITADKTAPTISSLAASDETDTTAVLSLTTSENATCKYDTTSKAYVNMTGTFTNTGNTTHNTSLSGLAQGTSYSYYVKCIDSFGNANSASSIVAFDTTGGGGSSEDSSDSGSSGGGAPSSGTGTGTSTDTSSDTSTDRTTETPTETPQSPQEVVEEAISNLVDNVEDVSEETKGEVVEMLEEISEIVKDAESLEIIENKEEIKEIVTEDVTQALEGIGMNIPTEDVTLVTQLELPEEEISVERLPEKVMKQLTEKSLANLGKSSGSLKSTPKVTKKVTVTTMKTKDNKEVNVVKFEYKVEIGDHIINIPKSIAATASEISGNFEVIEADPVLLFKQTDLIKYSVVAKNQEDVKTMEKASNDVSVFQYEEDTTESTTTTLKPLVIPSKTKSLLYIGLILVIVSIIGLIAMAKTEKK